MPRPKKSLANIPTKVMRRKTPINIDHLSVIEPLTDNQSLLFDAYKKEKNIAMIIDKKNILSANNKLDITKDITSLLNQKLKSIKIN